MGLVLVMDDEPNIALLLETVLRQEGHEVLKAFDGQAGLNHLEVNPTPDLVLVDLNMPIINGREVIAIMKQDPCLKKIPVIIITGSELGLEAFPPKEAYDLLLHKPFDIKELTTAVAMFT